MYLQYPKGRILESELKDHTYMLICTFTYIYDMYIYIHIYLSFSCFLCVCYIYMYIYIYMYVYVFWNLDLHSLAMRYLGALGSAGSLGSFCLQALLAQVLFHRDTAKRGQVHLTDILWIPSLGTISTHFQLVPACRIECPVQLAATHDPASVQT